MRSKGRITSWNDEKGYGFISPLAGGERTFVHIRAFAPRAHRPSVSDVVTYSLSADGRGRPCAAAATIAGVAAPARSIRRAGFPSQGSASGFLLLVAGAAAVSAIPMAVLAVYLVASLATSAAYALDKAAAKRGSWRYQRPSM